jgi:hypothetical protein
MHLFMGVFLCQFAMLKLFDVPKFAEAFAKYDLIAQRFRGYGTLYPFVELLFGLGYLSRLVSLPLYVATGVVFGIGAVGVITALRKGLELRCACMGTVLNVPLSTVTLVEDLGMGFMALGLVIIPK